MFWEDLQEAFYLTVGPFVMYILLPGMAGFGLLWAIVRFVLKIVGHGGER